MTRPMSEEREKLEPCPFCGGNASRHDPIRVARALLSTSSAERGMREALESIRYHSENQDMNHLTFRIKARECADAAIEKATKP